MSISISINQLEQFITILKCASNISIWSGNDDTGIDKIHVDSNSSYFEWNDETQEYMNEEELKEHTKEKIKKLEDELVKLRVYLKSL